MSYVCFLLSYFDSWHRCFEVYWQNIKSATRKLRALQALEIAKNSKSASASISKIEILKKRYFLTPSMTKLTHRHEHDHQHGH
jgi:hypothetical protein